MVKGILELSNFVQINQKCMRNKGKDLTYVYRSDKEDWIDIQKIVCRNTEECQKYMISTKGLCEICGSKYDIDKEIFVSECFKCGKEVDKLYGEFIPYLCKECL